LGHYKNNEFLSFYRVHPSHNDLQDHRVFFQELIRAMDYLVDQTLDYFTIKFISVSDDFKIIAPNKLYDYLKTFSLLRTVKFWKELSPFFYLIKNPCGISAHRQDGNNIRHVSDDVIINGIGNLFAEHLKKPCLRSNQQQLLPEQGHP
jgi:hypothetical protein